MTTTGTRIATNKIAPFIHTIRRRPVLLDSDLAELFQVETRVLNQAVKRNEKRFPTSLAFRLTDAEVAEVFSSKSQSVTLNGGRGSNLKYLPLAFTEAGAVMAASMLSSDHAIKLGPSLVRAFVQLEQKQKRPAQPRVSRWNYSAIDEIHELIYSGTYPTIAVLMKKIGASKGVVLRNLGYILDYKKMPLDFSRKADRFGYYYTGPVPKKLIHTFTETELLNQFIGSRSISPLPVKGSQKRLGLDVNDLGDLLDDRTRQMLDELDGTLYFRPFAPEEIDVNTFYTLHEGLRKQRVMEFDYLRHMADEAERKTVAGYCVTCAANSWYLVGRDVHKDEMRTYMLSRLTCPVVTAEKFKKPKDFSLEDHFDGAFIVMGGNESHDVLIEFNRWAAAYIRNRRFTRDQKVEELEHGGLRIGFHLKCLEEVEAWVCYWRGHAKVISPRPLQERLLKYSRHIQNTYESILYTPVDFEI